MSLLQPRPESQLAKKWEIVESSVGSILQKKDLRYSYQSIHQAIYTLSQANEGDAVFTALSRIFKECSENICTRLRSFTEKWFEEYLICSKDYLLRTALVERVLSYYNENYMVALRDTSLTWLASTILEVTIFSDPVAKDRLCENAKQAYHLDVSSSKKALHSLVSRPFGTPGSNIASVFINTFEEEAIKSLTDEKETGKYADVTDYFKWFEAVRERELDRFSPLNSGDYANFFTEFVDKLGQLLCGSIRDRGH
ncbi:Cullin family, putative [Angomonas deanei]|uniref:Cullin family, putative n=1 Tax=Angomonas deanei TaxID=59799 RepID=A0A7G2C5M7_9TRYP|nr:Cullin family, putative [Angomonas deanei]